MARLNEIWPKLSRNQRMFVMAMQKHRTKKDAAESIGLIPDTVYRWPDYVDEAADLITRDVRQAAIDILAGSLGEAVEGKVREMDSNDERVAAAARTEIIDRELGKPTTRSEVSMKADLNVESSTISDALSALTRRAQQLSGGCDCDGECDCQDCS